jgi:two-component system sensor histidine kinase PhoQ
MRSLRGRVMLSAAAVLAVAVLLTSLALEQAFRDSARSAREERLLGQVYLLMAAAEVENGHIVFPEDLAEPRFGLPGSGLYAAVLNAAGERIWTSRSTLGVGAPLRDPLPPGERRFEERRDPAGDRYFVERFGVTWATGPEPVAYTFAVGEDLTAYEGELARFRTGLAGWLGVMSLLMLAALMLVLRWGLAPLGRVAEEVAQIESGRRERIRGEYPAELSALTDNLNALLAHERAQQKRLGNALDDLAHSLKTPLAVMRGALEPGSLDPQTSEMMREQLGRMDHLVAYQLQRARSRAGAAAGLAPPVPIARTADRLASTLAKVYSDKGLRAEIRVPSDLVFRGAEGDLMELLGNLMDNAFKWGRARVRVGAESEHGGLRITVEDDGPGIPSDQVQQVLERGARADQAIPGHGIGLAVAREICEAYGATVEIGQSALGGALVRVCVDTPNASPISES